MVKLYLEMKDKGCGCGSSLKKRGTVKRHVLGCPLSVPKNLVKLREQQGQGWAGMSRYMMSPRTRAFLVHPGNQGGVVLSVQSYFLAGLPEWLLLGTVVIQTKHANADNVTAPVT